MAPRRQAGILGWGWDKGNEGSSPPRGMGRGPGRRVAEALLSSAEWWRTYGRGAGLGADLVLRRPRSLVGPLHSLTSFKNNKQVNLVNVKDKGGLEGKKKNVK